MNVKVTHTLAVQRPERNGRG